MFQSTFKYTFSALSLLLAMCVNAQDQPPPSTSSGKPATMKEMRELRQQEEKDWSIQYLKFSYDVIPTGRWIFKPSQKGQEVQAAAKFYKYIVVAEGGFQSIERARSDYNYKSSGGFFRLGAEVNLLKPNEQNGALTFGIRYAQCRFSDEIDYRENLGSEETPYYKNYQFENPNAGMIWMELTAGLNLVMNKNIHMGYTIRYKVLRNVSGINSLAPFDVPGFGRFEKENALGFSYYIGWAIPFGKEEELPPAEN